MPYSELTVKGSSQWSKCRSYADRTQHNAKQLQDLVLVRESSSSASYWAALSWLGSTISLFIVLARLAHAVSVDMAHDGRDALAQLFDGNAGQTMPANNSSNCALLLIVFPPSALHERLAPLFPNPRGWEPTAIRLPTAESRATIRVMAVNAFAAPRRRTFWKWQWGCLVAQKAFMTQPLGSRARHRPCGNAHRVPRLFYRSRQLCLRHHSPNFLRRSLLRPVNRTPEVEAATSFVSPFGSAIGPVGRAAPHHAGMPRQRTMLSGKPLHSSTLRGNNDAAPLHHVVDPLLGADRLDVGARRSFARRQAAAGYDGLVPLRLSRLCCHRRTTGNEDSRDCGKKQVVSIHFSSTRFCAD